MNLQVFENRFYICATLKMDTPLSIGSRPSLKPVGTDLPVLRDAEGLPYIPGSSIKGVVRTQMERVLRTLEVGGYGIEDGSSITPLRACDPLSKEKSCVNGNRIKELRKEYTTEEMLTSKVWEESCTACRIFGSPWLASRVYFKDSKISNKDELVRLFEIRDGVAIDRDLGTAKGGLKFDFEVVPAGAKFYVEIVGENMKPWEVGLLLLSIKPWERGEMCIGGKTTRGLGWGRLENLRVQLVDQGALLNYLIRGEKADKSPEEFEQVFVNSLRGKRG
ncbi:MAG: CRISPR-associated RAMP protein Csx7 [Thermoproteota archaeon]